ncbi:hypothetical protein LBMAG18_02010 [Alphaproteobacteria bacterium]|nr:hypothetical protein LBMAG18_02010 [Alphaproteobacteria bacterium]
MKNFFKLFAIEEKFAIDLTELESKYLQFQNKHHPDKSSDKSLKKILDFNEGYQVLNDDFLRASHLLQLKEIDILNDEKAIKPDKLMLMEILELQEHVAQITQKNAIEILQKNLKNTISDLINDFNHYYLHQEYKVAGQFLVKAKYLKKILADLKIKKQKLL